MNIRLDAHTPGVLPGGLNDTTWRKVFDALRGVAAGALDVSDLADYISNSVRLDSPWLDYIAQYALAYPEWVTDTTDAVKRARIAMWMRIRTCQGTMDALLLVLTAYGMADYSIHYAYDIYDTFFDDYGLERTPGAFAIGYQSATGANLAACERFVKAVWPVGRCAGFVKTFTYDVWVMNYGSSKMSFIKGARDYFGVGTLVGQNIANAAPTALSAFNEYFDGGPYATYAAAESVMYGLITAINAYTTFDGVIEVRIHVD